MTNDASVEVAGAARDRVLAAATDLFSEFGFEAATMQQIAEAAGVARATPGYFFGSKEGLWKAVLDEQSRAVAGIFPVAIERLGERRDQAAMLDALVDGVLEFQASHVAFLRLLQWSHLQGNRLIDESAVHGRAVKSAVKAVWSVLAPTADGLGDAVQVLLSCIGLCAAHLTFGATLGPPLGVDMASDGFLEDRRAHLKRLLRSALLA